MGFSQKGKLPDDFGGRIRVGLAEAGQMVGQILVKQARDGITRGSKSGRVYTTYFRTRGSGPGRQIFPVGSRAPHQASAPGEYSANDSGKLAGSIAYRMSGPGYITFYATAGHAGYQEFGTDKIAARENLKRAIEESDERIKDIIAQILWRALR